MKVRVFEGETIRVGHLRVRLFEGEVSSGESVRSQRLFKLPAGVRPIALLDEQCACPIEHLRVRGEGER